MYKHIFSLLLLITVNVTKAQTPTWFNYTNGDWINAIAEEGSYMWVGTEGGLARIDTLTGATIIYTAGNSGLQSNHVKAIAVDASGNKWIGTEKGLTKYDGTSWTNWWLQPGGGAKCIALEGTTVWIGGGQNEIIKFNGTTFTSYFTPIFLAQGDVTSIVVEASSGRKWITTLGGGTICFNGISWTEYTSTNIGYPVDNAFCSIVEIGTDAKWVGTSENLLRIDNDSSLISATVFESSSTAGFPSTAITSIEIEPNLRVWLGVPGLGLVKFCINTSCIAGSVEYTYDTSNSGLPSDYITTLKKASNGSLWVGTDKGVVKFNGTTWTSYNTNNSGMPGNTEVGPIVFQSNGDAWIGSMEQNGGVGLTKFDGTNWTVYDMANSPIPSNLTSAIAIDNSGTKWIGTDNAGLAKFDGTTWTTYNTSNSGIPSDYISSIAIDAAGNKWLGSFNTLTKFDGSTWTVYNSTSSSFLSYGVKALVIDGIGNKWIGNSSGLSKFDGSTWTIYNSSNSPMPSDYVSTIAIDGPGNIWLGSWDWWLMKFDGTSSWTEYNYNIPLWPSDAIFSLAIDQNDTIWLGVDNRGLVKFDGDTTWTLYTQQDIGPGLPDNNVLSIGVDVLNNKWIGTSGGICIYSESGILTSLSSTAPLNETKNIFIYPNPNGGQFNMSSKDRILKIEIHNILGQIIHSSIPNSEKTEIDISTQPAGIYFVKIKTENGVGTKKIIIE